MTKRLPVSELENIWYDSQQVDSEDLITEQEHVDQGRQAIINNHIGTGILPATLSQRVVLDTRSVVGALDGKPIFAQLQPTDDESGVQLEFELADSDVFGRRKIKVAVIGLDFQGNLQYDTFVFARNEKQYTKKHYKEILSFLFNDARGTSGKSFNLLGSGHLTVRETSPMTISRDTIMLAQDVEPNLFFRDFFLDSGYANLNGLLTAATPSYSIDTLGISTSYKQLRKISVNDVTTQIGQKFIATTNNIQKVTLLLGVDNLVTASDLNWTGDLVASIYPLQSILSCASDITPELAIDFPPSNLPLAQASVNLTTLLDSGVELDGYLQPVDFVFSNTPIANGGLIPGSYYALTIKRSGSADKCNIFMPVGNNQLDNSHLTIFNGTIWVDVPEEDAWFQIWTDAAKVSDGMAYDAGQGLVLPKTNVDLNTGATIDYNLDNISFSTTQLYYGLVRATIESSEVVQDQRTGNPVFSRKKYIPTLDLVTSSELAERQEASEPIIIGTIQDKNVKSFDAANSILVSKFTHFAMFKNEVVIKLSESSLDPNNHLNLIAAFSNGEFTDAKFVPDASTPGNFYRIARADLVTMVYGDVDGDGIVSDSDYILAQTLLNKGLATAPTSALYATQTNPFVSNTFVTYEIVDSIGAVIEITPGNPATGTGHITIDSVDPNFADFIKITGPGTFTTISNLLSYKLKITSATDSENIGTFDISAVVSSSKITIKKYILDGAAMQQIMRADLDGDFIVGVSDISNINNYVLRAPGASLKIGTTFRVLKLKLESFIDRNDEYPGNIANRDDSIHAIEDVPLSDTLTFLNFSYTSSPLTFNIVKRLIWRDDLVVSLARAKEVPAIFSDVTAAATYSCTTDGTTEVIYPATSVPNPGRNDFLIPSNLVLGNQIVNKDGSLYKPDLEVGTLVLEIPTVTFDDEKTVNIFTDFVCDHTGNGTTRLGFAAMRFADCSFVGTSAVTSNQVRFAVSLQSFYSETDGEDLDGYTGVLVDPKMGVSIDYTTGLLTLNFSHLKKEAQKLTLTTKLQISVYLKRSGFNNNFLFVDSTKMQNILGL